MVLRFTFGLGFALALSASTVFAAGEQAPLQIVVSRDQQSLVVYDGDTVVATSNVSTGKAGHSTPTGIFSILEKRRFHKSNIYSNAPMPFMQRLTWSGIALHASNHVPSYPASHGCVRMPDAFAKQLFKMTGRGVHVLISDRQLTPVAISDPFLFQPREKSRNCSRTPRCGQAFRRSKRNPSKLPRSSPPRKSRPSSRRKSSRQSGC